MDARTLSQLRFSELRDFIDEIQNELNRFNELVKDKPETAFTRRLKVRVMFSLLEAHVAHLKGVAQTIFEARGETLDEEKELLLQDLQRRKMPDGKIRIVGAKLSLKENSKLAFWAFGKAVGVEHNVDFGGAGGQAFLAAIELRDRVVHPKSSTDWRVSEKEAELCDKAWHWFGENLVVYTKPFVRAEKETAPK